MNWLLIAVGLAVVAAFLGHRLRRRREQARAYLKGVRSMISDDPDAAIEALSDAARLSSPEAVETYLALGDLFKREGDVTRAIRLHRNMLHRPGLPAGRRAEVERELADDYRRAGMLEDAAEAYRKLMGAGDALAAAGLRDVLVDQKRHAEAVEVHRSRCTPDARLLAHLLAARSRELREADPAGALSAAREAEASDPGSADALLALSEALSASRRRGGCPGRAGTGARRVSGGGAALLAGPGRARSRAGGPCARSRARRAPRRSPACSPCAAGRWRRRGGRPRRWPRSRRRSPATATARWPWRFASSSGRRHRRVRASWPAGTTSWRRHC